jgi:hypothetical protein
MMLIVLFVLELIGAVWLVWWRLSISAGAGAS